MEGWRVMNVAVIGAGSWGTALGNLLAGCGHSVRIWAREPEVVDSINRQHENTMFLPGFELESGLVSHGEIASVLRGAELVLSASPSHAVREVATEMASVLNHESPLIVSVSKGLETESLKPMTEVLEEVLPGKRVVALSGPSFADEVCRRHPTTVVAAAADSEAAEAVQLAMVSDYFRIYTSSDPLGVQLGGALKNVIAIASGLLDGLGLGYNSKAALITRGLAEMARLGQALGCDSMTFAGLAGMGDLMLTAFGPQSRNRSLGQELASGRSLEEILSERVSVAEGVRTTRAAVALGAQNGVELPIAQEVEQILFEGKEPKQALRDLMERGLKPENWS
jgi:glycerol-3-phosphate dehydrogenase (NAD(P)+)